MGLQYYSIDELAQVLNSISLDQLMFIDLIAKLARVREALNKL